MLLVLVAIVAGCSGGGAETKYTAPPVIPAPALPAVDAALLAPAAIGAMPSAFHLPGRGSVKTFATLAEGEQATQIAFTPDGEFLVSIDFSDYHVRVWDWRTGTLASKQKHTRRPSSFALQPDGSGIWIGAVSGHLSWWPLSGGQLAPGISVGTELGENEPSIAISPNGLLLATASYGKVLSLWDTAGRKKLAQITTDDHLRKCVFSPDGRRLIVGTATNQLYEYMLGAGTGRKVQIMPVRPDVDLMSLGFSADGKRFSTGHNQPWITVWDGENLVYQRFLKCPETGGVSDLAFTPDRALLAFALSSGELFLWKPDDPEESGKAATLAAGEKLIRCLAFSPDGRTLASGDEGGMIKLWASAE